MRGVVLLSVLVRDGGFRLRPGTSTFRVVPIIVLKGGCSDCGSQFALGSAQPRITRYLRSGDDLTSPKNHEYNVSRIGSWRVVSSPVPHHPAYGSVQSGSDQARASLLRQGFGRSGIPAIQSDPGASPGSNCRIAQDPVVARLGA